MSDFDEYWDKRNNSAKVYDFKAVGIKDTVTGVEEEKRVFLDNQKPIGIKTPLELGFGSDGLLAMHKTLEDQIHDNFRNLVMTNYGDRLGFYDFGANLTELVHELGSENIDNEAIRRIKKATSKYIPFISLKTFESFNDNRENQHTAKVGIRIVYDVPALSVVNKALEVVLYVSG